MRQQGSRKSQRSEIFGKRRSGVRTRALPLGAKRERSRLLRRGGAFPKTWLWNAQFDYWKGSTLRHPERSSGLPSCHPERSKAKPKDLYADIVDIFIEIPRQARDDRKRALRQARDDGHGNSFPFSVPAKSHNKQYRRPERGGGSFYLSFGRTAAFARRITRSAARTARGGFTQMIFTTSLPPALRTRRACPRRRRCAQSPPRRRCSARGTRAP